MAPNFNLFTAPLQSDVVSPGFLVYNKTSPQQHFDPPVVVLNKRLPKVSKSALQYIRDVQNLCRSHRLEFSFTDFLSSHLGMGSRRSRSIEAEKGETILLLQAEEWLKEICSVRSTKMWLEDMINQSGRKVWMVVGKVVLTDAKVALYKQHDHSVGGTAQVPLLSVTGVPLPTPLDPGLGADTSRESSHDQMVTIPGETIFMLLYRRVELRKIRQKLVTIGTQYDLQVKATWKPLWQMRGGEQDDSDTQSISDFRDEYGVENEPDHSEEVLECFLGDEEDAAYGRMAQE